MILKFSFGIIFSITFLGLGNSILLSIKITPKKISKTKVIFIINPKILAIYPWFVMFVYILIFT